MSTHPYIVARPVVDIRSLPSPAAPDVHDAMEETQALYGEPVRVTQRKDGWALVEAMEQPEFSHAGRWQGYPGWLPESALAEAPWYMTAPTLVVTDPWVHATEDAHGIRPSPWRFAMGTFLFGEDFGGTLWRVELHDGTFVWLPHDAARPLEEQRRLPDPQKRAAILRSATALLGDAYYWGGRSPRADAADGAITGVDCSALVNLAYRTVGMVIPRDAHEQSTRARAVPAPRPGDLVFLSERGNPRKIVHVMLYAGDGALIESPGTGYAVRRITVKQRLGRPIGNLAPGTVVGGQTVTFGALLAE